jgi:spermidine synthase
MEIFRKVKPHVFKSSLLIMGLSGIIAQILLLREFLVSFLGNELTLGIILANWLLLEALGSFCVGRLVKRVMDPLVGYVILQLIFSVALPTAIYLSRTFKVFLSTTPGEALGFGSIFLASFLITLPAAISHGALFTYGSQLYSQGRGDDSSSIGTVYALETIGTIFGGFILSFLLIRTLSSFEIAFLVSLVNGVASALLLWPEHRLPRFNLRLSIWGISILFSLLYAYLLLPAESNKISLSAIQRQWRGLDVVHHENSIYGNITVTRQGEQFTFFADGVSSITVPVPDIASIEDFVHFPMLIHGTPETVLILSGGAGGMIHEILKYPVSRIDYVELDPLLLKLIRTFQTPLTRAELSDPRVQVHPSDGRFFLRERAGRYDIILIGISSPRDLQSNRLFTREFFELAKRKMNEEGVIVLSLPGSLTYISPELRDLNKCIWETLKSVYRSVRVIPGDVNLYLASDSKGLESISANNISRRLENTQIKTSLLTRGYVEDRLHERWLQWFSTSIKEGRVSLNSDFHPAAVFYDLSYWNALFSPYLTGVFKPFERFGLELSLALMVLVTGIGAALFKRAPQRSRYGLPYAILTTGFAGMIFELAIIFTFQTFYGYLYYQIGILITLFMMGIAAGSLFITHRLNTMARPISIFLKTDLAMVIFSLLLPATFSVCSDYLEKTSADFLLYSLFLILSFLVGSGVGIQFPLAAKLSHEAPSGGGTVGQTAALIYGADLFGGFFGGLLGGILFLPVLGLWETCLVVAMIKASSFALLLLFLKNEKGAVHANE